MRYYRLFVLIFLGVLLQNKYAFAANNVEIDGLIYEYVNYNGPLPGYGEVYIVGCSSNIPEDLEIPFTVKYQERLTKRQCFVSTISSGAFLNCSKLKSINTAGVNYINDHAFQNCTSLKKVSFGGGCKSIGSGTFTGCTSIDTVYYHNSATIADNAFDESTYQTAKLIVADQYKEECESHKVWSKFQNKIYSHSISIGVSYGSVSYNGVIVKSGDPKIFEELDGSSVTLTFSPEQGRELANLIIDGEDVTSKVVNNQYRIDNVSKSMKIQVSFFSITISAKGNGHILCKEAYIYNPDEVQYEYGDTRNGTKSYIMPSDYYLYFYIYPDDGHQLTKVIKNGVDITTNVDIDYPIIFSKTDYSTSLEFTFEEIPPVTHTLSIKSIGNGSVSFDEISVREDEKSFSIEEGLSPVLLFTPDAGHQIKSVKVNGKDVTSSLSNNRYTINNINADISIEVLFEPIFHTLTIVSSGFGDASYNGVSIHDKTQTFSVVEGTSPTITLTPETGYRIASVKLDETDVTASVVNNTYTIRSISADMTLSVSFEAIPTYTLSVTSSGNGSTYFNNTTVRNKTEAFTVNGETDATITFTPDDGYCISSVKVNGVDVTSSVINNQYTISKISANTTIAVTYGAITHTLSITALGNGRVTYNYTDIRNNTETFTVNEGTSATVTFAPDAGYRIASVKLNNTDVTASVANNQYTISNITANTTLIVTFEAIPPMTYTFAISAVGNGTVTYDGNTVRGKTSSFTVVEGTNAVVKFAADEGHRLKSVKLDNTDVTSSVVNNQYTIRNIKANTSLEVTFESIPTYSLNITASGNGSVTYNGTAVRGKTQTFTVKEGTSATVTFAPDAGYRIASVKLNNTDVTASVANNSYTISNMTANTTLAVTFEAIPPTTYAFTISAVGNGTVTYDGNTVRGKTSSFTVVEGTNAVVKFSADEGYRLKSVKLDNTDVTSSVKNNQYTISNIKTNTSLEVTFEAIPTYALNITASGNGCVTYNNIAVRGKTQTFTASEGTSATIKFTPDAGYKIKSVKLNSTDVTSSIVNNQYTINNINTDNTLEVEFEAITHTLTIKAMGNGSATFNSTAVKGKSQAFTVNEGTSATITFTPDAGYRIKSVKLNTTDVTASVANNQYTISNIKSDNTLEVEFEAITHTLTIKAIGNGSATFNSIVVKGKSQSFTVNEGTSAIITFTPDAGYRIKSVKLNATDVTASVANNQYTISNIKSDNTLEVEFEAIIHTLNIVAVGNGNVDYNGIVIRNQSQSYSVQEGSSVVLSFAPDADYRVGSVKVNNTDVTANVTNNSYTISNITANTTLSVTFEAIPPTTYVFTISAVGNGTVTYDGNTVRGKTSSFTVVEGTNAVVTFAADDGYRLKSVKLNNTDVTSSVVNNQYTIRNIKANTSLEVTFEAIPTYSLNITASGNGSVTYNGTAVRGKTQAFTVREGTSATITFAPDAGYRIASVKLNNTDVTASVANSQYTISNITANTTLAVTFEAIPPTTYAFTISAVGNGTVTYDGNTVRGKTSSFTVVEGTNVIVTFSADEGYRLKSVKLGNTDVTSSVVNNQYTIRNIKANTSLEVTFEAIPTYSLNIMAIGNGSAIYNGTAVRGKTQTFTVKEGTSATVTFTPDAGYRIASVKLNNTDVTASVANSSYTISNITANTTLSVTFEAIPPTTYTFTISAVGNGTVTYDGNAVRGKTSSFTVVEGTNAVVTFSADESYRLKSMKLNNTDVTSSVVNNQYTISNIKANTSLEVTFEAIPTYALNVVATGNGSASYNGVTIRNQSQSFTLREGTSAVVSFSADNGYRIASVKVNNADVTSQIVDGKITVSSITQNTNVEVVFEEIPPTVYALSITATGNGSVTYDGKTIKGKTSTFTIIEGSYVTVQLSADDGYKLKSITLNGQDVTEDVVNNQYTTPKIMADAALIVVFEAIPTFTLTVKSSAFGSVKYGDVDVTNRTETFSVREGTSATMTFTPDDNGRLRNIILNGTDITNQLVNGQYTISNIKADQSVEAEFVEDITKVTNAGVAYTVTSYDDQTVVVAAGNYGNVLTVPASFTAKEKTWTVVGIDEDALKDNTTLAAIIWNPEVAFTAKVSNPNLLLYVKAAQYAPATVQNVVVGDDDEGEVLMAENIVLVEAASGNDFYCPQAFTAKRISYEHNYSMISGYKTCQGWETLVLPFDVTMMINAKGQELTPYTNWQYGNSQRPFWLYEMTTQGWKAGSGIKANTPYVISMPNNEMYDVSFNQTGNIQFIGTNVEVKASTEMTTGQYGNKRLVANYQTQEASAGIYALNVSNEWSQNTATEAEGSTFIRSLRSVHPFEAYLTVEGSNAPWAIPIFENDVLTDMSLTPNPSPKGEGSDDWYDLQGRKLQGEPKKAGIYIYKGEKVRR